MCGIFALFHILSSQQLAQRYNSIEDHYYKGRNRGPEYSTLNSINNNILFGFHRLAINGIDEISNQPIVVDGIYLICNGEIYNYKNIYTMLNITPKTNSDCEAIIHLYKKYGIEYTLQMLDGVFAFSLYDSNINKCFVARDPFGVRPLYIGVSSSYDVNTDSSDDSTASFENSISSDAAVHGIDMNDIDSVIVLNNDLHTHYLNDVFNDIIVDRHSNMIVYSSLLKQLTGICNHCRNFKAGTYSEFHIENNTYYYTKQEQPYTTFNFNHNSVMPFQIFSQSYPYDIIYNTLLEAVKKRVITMERNLACLLSGGLDSSLISAMVSKFVPKGKLQTYSIGMRSGSDLKYAKMVSTHIESQHTEVLLTEEEFFNAIPEVIYNIESYDTTTVRASVGNYLVSKYISDHSDSKVIFNGDGSDELTGGYMYFHKCPNDIEFDHECKRLLRNIQFYDVLRSDRSISCHGLEARTPFLDRTFVHTYLSLPMYIRNHNNNNNMEKYLLRKSIEVMDPKLLPYDVLWRTKEAFSDGVSSQENSWYEIIQQKLDVMYDDIEFREKCKKYTFNTPTTKEQLYYREVFEGHFKGRGKIIPDFWMPKYCDAKDSSARLLDIYKDKIISNGSNNSSNNCYNNGYNNLNNNTNESNKDVGVDIVANSDDDNKSNLNDRSATDYTNTSVFGEFGM